MFSTRIRWTLVFVMLLAGLASVGASGWTAALCWTGSGLLIWGHRRYGTVHAAFSALRRGNAARAASLLDEIADPSRLARSQRGYYEWLRGLLCMDADLVAAELHMRAALRTGLRTRNDASIVRAQLATVLARMGRFDEASDELMQARQGRARAEVVAMIDAAEAELSERREEHGGEPPSIE